MSDETKATPQALPPEKVRYYVEKFAGELNKMPPSAHGYTVQALTNDFQYRVQLLKEAQEQEVKAAHDAAVAAAATAQREAQFGIARSPQ